MTLPGLILGTVVGALIGGVLHLIVGGNIGRLLLYVLFGIADFWIGHLLAEFTGLTFFSYGPVHYGMALPVCLVLTGFWYWLSLVQTTTIKK